MPMPTTFAKLVLPLLLALTLTACGTQSPQDRLRSQSDKIEQQLLSERDTVDDLGPTNLNARQKNSHLSRLRRELSIANISLATVPVILKETQHQEIAYAVLQEVYATIQWNIPLWNKPIAPTSSPFSTPPSLDAQKTFPSLFSPSAGLNFQAIQSGISPTSPTLTLPPQASPSIRTPSISN